MEPRVSPELVSSELSCSSTIIDGQGNEVKSAHQTKARFPSILSPFGLGRLFHLELREPRSEDRKIALHKHRRIAITHCFFHLIPLGAAFAILFMYWHHHFVGYHFRQGPALQFAAKLHEIFMQASIAEIILTYIRVQAWKGFIPLGSIMAAYQTSQLSYLWSWEIWAALSSPAMTKRGKVLFMALVPTMILLAGVVGPSTAVAMLPRQMISKPIDSVPFIIKKSPTALFLNRFDFPANKTIDDEAIESIEKIVPYFNFPDIELPLSEGAVTSRLLYISRADPVQLKDNTTVVQSAMAQMPSKLAAKALRNVSESAIQLLYFKQRLGSWKDVSDAYRSMKISTDMFHPTVYTRCHSQCGILMNKPVQYLADDGRTRENLTTVEDLFDKLNQSWVPGWEDAPPVWYQSPQPGSKSLVGVFPEFAAENCPAGNASSLNLTFSELFSQSRVSCITLRVCTISAFWEFSRHEYAAGAGSPLVHITPVKKALTDTTNIQNPICLHPEQMSGIQSPARPILTKWKSEGALSAFFVRILADKTPDDGVKITNRLDPPIFPATGTLLPGTRTRFDAVVYESGYGYSLEARPVRLSVAVLGIYCLVVLSYLGYIIFTGTASTAWNSVGEMLLLALQSRRPIREEEQYTSVGVKCIQTFAKPVGIRVNDKEELELVLACDPDHKEGDLTKLVPNKAY